MFGRKHKAAAKDESLATSLIPGLINTSAGCYLNCAIQGLASLKYLRNALPQPGADSGSASHTSPSLQQLLDDQYPPDLPLTSALNNILNKLWSATDTKRPINPAELQRALSVKNEDYDGSSQQDAHEVLLTILDQMRLEEVDLIKKLRPPKVVSKKVRHSRQTTPGANAATKSLAEYEETSSGSSSSSSSESEEEITPEAKSPNPNSPASLEPFVDTIFCGQLASFIVCDECKHVSLSFEPFTDICISIKGDAKRKRDRLRSLLSRSAAVDHSSNQAPKKGSHPSIPSDNDFNDTDDESLEKLSRSVAALDTSFTDGKSEKEEALNRRKSLDPATLNRSRSMWEPSKARNARSRDTSPERANNTTIHHSRISNSPSRSKTHHHHHHQHHKTPKLSLDQAKYIKSILAEVPPKGSMHTPLEILRASYSQSHAPVHPEKEEVIALQNMQQKYLPLIEDALYIALQRFTAVEVLEGENSFQCRRCWKILHPELVKPKKQKVVQSAHSSNIDNHPTGDVRHPADRIPDSQHRLSSSPVMSSQAFVPGWEQGRTRLSLHIPTIAVDNDARSSISPDSDGIKPMLSVSPSISMGSSLPPSDVESYVSDFTDTDNAADTEAESVISVGVQSNGKPSSSPISNPSKSVTSGLNLNMRSRIQRPPKAERYVKRKAHKRFLISHLSEVLLIHFNRFQQTKSSLFSSQLFTSLKKVDDYVAFPLVLDLAPFLAPLGKPPKAPTTNEKEKVHLSPAQQSRHQDDPRLQKSKYSLSAVIVHNGSMASGHYICFSRQTSHWLYCSDEEVRAAPIAEVLGCRAYLLLYEAVQ